MSDEFTMNSNGENMSLQDAAEKAKLIMQNIDKHGLPADSVWDMLTVAELMPKDGRQKKKILRMAGLTMIKVGDKNGEEERIVRTALLTESSPPHNPTPNLEVVNGNRRELKPLAITDSKSEPKVLQGTQEVPSSLPKGVESVKPSRSTQQEVHTFNLRGGTVMIESIGKTINATFTGVAQVVIYIDVEE